MRKVRTAAIVVVVVTGVVAAGCSRRQAPVTQPAPPPETPSIVTAAPPAAAERVEEVLPVPPEPVPEDTIADRSLEDLNRNSPLMPAFFGLDSAELDAEARAIVMENAQLLRQYPTWVVTIEGHCDERGTAEYNLALGERRAVATRTYLVSLGVAPDRLRIVSYGKEFPFDPGQNDTAWASNRRAHFVITSK